ncbi:MAG: phytanoyl-CoA dioxygenase family protein [Gammaproteobacteria bacterium]|nr:phytanoyl-CoA dioxygenase family protein [Gammaproteobacteria bacterium]
MITDTSIQSPLVINKLAEHQKTEFVNVLDSGDVEIISEVLVGYIEQYPGLVDYFVEWAKQSLYEKNLKNAETILSVLKQGFSSNYSVCFHMANYYAQAGQINEAIGYWEKCLDSVQYARDADTLIRLGSTLVKSGSIDEKLFYVNKLDLEIHKNDVTEARLKSLMAQFGAVVIRDGLEASICEKYLENFQFNIDKCFSGLSGTEVTKHHNSLHLPMHFIGKKDVTGDLRSLILENISEKDIGNWSWKEFDRWFDPKNIVNSVVFNELSNFIQSYIGAGWSYWRSTGYARRVNLRKKAGGVSFHQDGGTGYWQNDVIALWIPLVECGGQAPGLEIVPVGMRNLFPWQQNESETINPYPFMILEKMIPQRDIVALDLNPGDIVLFNNFTLHRTQVLDVAKTRFSFDFRFFDINRPLSWRM